MCVGKLRRHLYCRAQESRRYLAIGDLLGHEIDNVCKLPVLGELSIKSRRSPPHTAVYTNPSGRQKVVSLS
jgi:hypothetical protein